jgi:hypothetical protein
MKTATELFKTYGEAQKFCDSNGFEDFVGFEPWKLADAILKLKEKQHKITRHACRESIKKMKPINEEGKPVVYQVEAVQTIINTKAVELKGKP